MVIRDATREDLAGIVAIYNATVPSRLSTADLEPVSVESRVAWLERRDRARHPLWVAELDGELAGWLGFEQFYGRAAYAATAELSVYVAAGRRRAGVGSALLERALQRAPGFGLSTLLALVFAHNEPSVQLFARRGFERWGYLPRVALLDGVERDLLVLGRRVRG
jgi:L-amino acid N-acyltransferase YncA